MNNHLGIEQSRRDDLESLEIRSALLFKRKVALARSSSQHEETKVSENSREKVSHTVQASLQGISSRVYQVLGVLSSTSFRGHSDYKFLKSLFEQVLRRHPESPKVFDWVKRKKDKSKSDDKKSSSSSGRKEGDVRRSSGGERLRGFDTSGGGGGGHGGYVRNSSSADASGVRRSSSILIMRLVWTRAVIV